MLHLPLQTYPIKSTFTLFGKWTPNWPKQHQVQRLLAGAQNA